MRNHFDPTWESLAQYVTPDWFRDAKFGIWAHWGPQCEPERGDWYARGMYLQGDEKYREHLAQYGHPSEFGFKDVIHSWKAERWDPQALVALYKRAGAEYFVAMANHHDNLDLWDSRHQPWNSTAVGPKRNVVAEWAEAAKAQNMRFGVSVHASHAWSWYEPAQGADTEGPLAGVPYDGKLTKDDGMGTWWEGLDPQDLYEQSHTPTPMAREMYAVVDHWFWGNGYPPPSEAYCDRFLRRTVDLIDKYEPDLVYFDDSVLPLYPVSDVGLRIAAHFYNANPNAVMNGKFLDEEQRKTMVWDIERGASDAIEPLPWQTDTCIGDWHYKQSLFDEDGYKSAKTVVQTLADVVSKNGNLLLSVPLRGDGTLDEKEIAIVEQIGEWMRVHRECIVGTRPWKVSGEGPASASAQPLRDGGFNEGTGIPFSASDVRFTMKGDFLYAIALGHPAGELRIGALGLGKGLLEAKVGSVKALSTGGELSFEQGDEALTIYAPVEIGNDLATVYQIELSR